MIDISTKKDFIFNKLCQSKEESPNTICLEQSELNYLIFSKEIKIRRALCRSKDIIKSIKSFNINHPGQQYKAVIKEDAWERLDCNGKRVFFGYYNKKYPPNKSTMIFKEDLKLEDCRYIIAVENLEIFPEYMDMTLKLEHKIERNN